MRGRGSIINDYKQNIKLICLNSLVTHFKEMRFSWLANLIIMNLSLVLQSYFPKALLFTFVQSQFNDTRIF